MKNSSEQSPSRATRGEVSVDEHKAQAVMQELVDSGQVTDPDSARGKLLQMAAHLFRSKGYERTTVRDLASIYFGTGYRMPVLSRRAQFLDAVQAGGVDAGIARYRQVAQICIWSGGVRPARAIVHIRRYAAERSLHAIFA